MKILYKLSLPFLLFLFAFQSTSYAATITWTGDVSTVWNDIGNWSGGAIPNFTDDVIIPSGRPNEPVIESPLFILLVSMVVESGASVTINSGATLAINDALGDGIDNAGTISNAGTINIRNVAGRGIFNHSGAVFTNADGARISVGFNSGSIGDIGISNLGSTSLFTNEGQIQIDSTADNGLFNEGTFNSQNSGSIEIGLTATIDGFGIRNSGTFNNAGDTLEVFGTRAAGIRTGGIFHNTSVIVLENIGVTGGVGILNTSGGSFINDSTINIGTNNLRIRSSGIRNEGASTDFQNIGTINIERTNDAGIRNLQGATFTNSDMAILNIGQNNGRINRDGIFNTDGNTSFVNAGTINVDSTGINGIFNLSSATFTNQNNGKIQIGLITAIDEIGIRNTATFNNTGDTIKIFNARFNAITNGGTFQNTSVITIENIGSVGAGGTGILNNSGGSFINDSTINIGTNNLLVGGNGIRNEGSNTDFQNNGIINIERTNEVGIRNLQGATFTNSDMAILNIGQNNGRINRDGIFNSGGSSSFVNAGTINIDNTGINGVFNQSGASFDNVADGKLHIGKNAGSITRNGIFTQSNFTNSSIITIDDTRQNGIVNQGAFTNQNSGHIQIGQIGTIVANGIRLTSGSSFKNIGGQIDIDNLGNSVSGINIDNAQFIDSTGIIRLGLNHPFGRDAFIINNNNATFTGNDSTTIQCVGDFLIGASSTVSGIGELELEGDWENNATFSADSSSVTIIGATQSIIGGSNTTTFFDLAINNLGNVTLENDVTVTRQLSLEAGQVSLGDNDFTLGDNFELITQVGTSALVTDGLGEVISTVDNGASRIFPVGNSNYTPITIQNDGTSDEFSVQCLPEVLEDGISGSAFVSDVVNTTWFMEEAVAGSTNATLTAQWTSAEELSGFDRSSAFLSRYAGTAWEIGGAISANGTDPYTITRAGVTAFSPFAIGTSFVSDFSCVANDLELDEVALASGTYSSQQSIESASLIESGSIVEFIAANVIELKVGFRAQSGSTFAAIIDDCTLSINENEMIEQRTEIAAQPITRTTLLFPNPVGQHLNIRDGIGQAVIYNMLGQEIQAFEIRDDLHTLDVSGLASGQYVLLILRESGERVTLGFVK